MTLMHLARLLRKCREIWDLKRGCRNSDQWCRAGCTPILACLPNLGGGQPMIQEPKPPTISIRFLPLCAQWYLLSYSFLPWLSPLTPLVAGRGDPPVTPTVLVILPQSSWGSWKWYQTGRRNVLPLLLSPSDHGFLGKPGSSCSPAGTEWELLWSSSHPWIQWRHVWGDRWGLGT